MALPIRKKVRFNYHDYELLPEDKRYELIDGELYMTPAPTSEHQRIILKISYALNSFILQKKTGEIFISPIDVVLSFEDVVQPDLVFISRSRKKIITEKNIQGPPDLVIEVLSPSTAERDRVTKKRLYEQYGVEEMWIVNPETKTIEVVGWKGSEFVTLKTYPEKATLVSGVLKSFKLKVKEIF